MRNAEYFAKLFRISSNNAQKFRENPNLVIKQKLIYFLFFKDKNPELNLSKQSINTLARALVSEKLRIE